MCVRDLVMVQFNGWRTRFNQRCHGCFESQSFGSKERPWPCSYFLVNDLSGNKKAGLTKECTAKLHNVGVKVVSFTCDGPTSYQSMLKALGARLSPDNLQAYFEHPCDPIAKLLCVS